MFAAGNLQKHCFKTLSSLILKNPSKNVMLLRSDVSPKFIASNVIHSSFPIKDVSFSSAKPWICLDGSRAMSTGKGKSMRSKVESRMRKESGKTLREIRRAKKLRKKLMTDEERLIYNLRRAKKKVALLLQRLKKFELPELPAPRHDPELLTPEQLQAYKKIGFRNRNYVPVGVRGVFGGVVQNMHLHWKFHETVQVCCDNFPKEKIKEMATMLARLSGGIVINIHNVKTIIMFRGRNYRQPKNLIPINTLTKRKALFKARFEQALDSQKLNIKKIEQQLRRMGVNPDDPVAMASIQRVASTFFNAIDKKEGSPYVFHGEKRTATESISNLQQPEPAEDSDQEELDKFIADIEEAADKEWAAEEAAEKEEISKIRYWNREDLGSRFRKSEIVRSEDSDDEIRGQARSWKDMHGRQRINDSDDGEDNISEGYDEWDSNDVGDTNDHESDSHDSDEAHGKFNVSKVERQKQDKIGKANGSEGFKRNSEPKFGREVVEEDSGSEDMLGDLEGVMWESDDEKEPDLRESRAVSYDHRGSGDKIGKANSSEGFKRNTEPKFARELVEEDMLSDLEDVMRESDNEKEPDLRESRAVSYDYRSSSDEEEYHCTSRHEQSGVNVLKDLESDIDDSDEAHNGRGAYRAGRGEQGKNSGRFKRPDEAKMTENMSSDSDVAMWPSDMDDEFDSKVESYNYGVNDEDKAYHMKNNEKNGIDERKKKTQKEVDEAWDSE